MSCPVLHLPLPAEAVVRLPQVLVADDSPVILAAQAHALARAYRLVLARNGREVLELAERHRPQAAVIDLSMPELDGDRVLQRMQADGALRHIPVIIASAEKERAQECLRQGAAAMLVKPVDGHELRQVLARVMEQARAERELTLLPLRAGDHHVAVELGDVESAHLMPSTRPLRGAPPFARRVVERWGRRLPVVDLALRLGSAPRVPPLDRRLVVLRGHPAVALEVDHVGDLVTARPGPADAEGDPAVRGVAHSVLGALPVLSPNALLLHPARRSPAP